MIKGQWYTFTKGANVWIFKFDEFNGNFIDTFKSGTINDGWLNDCKGGFVTKDCKHAIPATLEQVRILYPNEIFEQISYELY